MEKEFLLNYYKKRLQFFKQLNLDDCTKEALIKHGEEASCLKKIMEDYYEEGYDHLTEILIELKLFEFLQTFIENILTRLNEPSEQKLFHLLAQTAQVNCLSDSDYTSNSPSELNQYLMQFQQQNIEIPDISSGFDSLEKMELWKRNTKTIMSEQIKFLDWCVNKIQQQPNVTPIFLLRDTLLPYLGYLALRELNPDLPEAQPFLLSRKFLSYQTGNEDFYLDLGEIIYRILIENPDFDKDKLSRRFSEYALSHPNLPENFLQSCHDYLEVLQLNNPMLIVETGLHATFPLWLLALTQNSGDFLLYATAPWLKSNYKDSVFCPNYNYLRNMETITIHEYLFQFHSFSDGQVYIEQSNNTHIKALSLYELACFKQQLQKKFKR